MKILRPSFCALLLAVASAAPLRAQPGNGTGTSEKPQTVETEDGKEFFGIVTIKDDYTIVIATDASLANLPIASLKGDSWQKFSKDKERKDDGRFWSERQDTLTSKWNKDGQKQPLEVVLAPLTTYFPAIISYKETKPPETVQASGSPAQQPSPPSTGSQVEIKLFSGPGALGAGGLPSVPNVPGMGSIPTAVPGLP